MSNALRYTCPFCDADVLVGKPCLGCAKKAGKPKPAKKPWEQDASADGLDLADDDFDYDDFVAREFGKAPHRQAGLKWYWWVLAIVIMIGMLYGVFR
jgi:hypothetical protein